MSTDAVAATDSANTATRVMMNKAGRKEWLVVVPDHADALQRRLKVRGYVPVDLLL